MTHGDTWSYDDIVRRAWTIKSLKNTQRPSMIHSAWEGASLLSPVHIPLRS